jgi:hypothetical protein
MEEAWIADRTTLRHLLSLHPSWTHPQFADCLQRSLSWVKKWRKRFAQADPDDLAVVFGLSRARHTPSLPWISALSMPFSTFGTSPWRTLGACQDPRPSCPICLVTPDSLTRMCACLVPHAPSGKSCAATTVFSRCHTARSGRGSDLARSRRSRLMRTRCLHGGAGSQWRRQTSTSGRDFQLCGCQDLNPVGLLCPPGLPRRNRLGGARAILA